MADVIAVRWQYCRNGYDITTDFYAETDALVVRAWQDDFCLIEVTKNDEGRWEPTGGDGSWVDLADDTFATPGEALAVYLEGLPYEIVS